MKKIGQFLNNKRLEKKTVLDEKSLAYVFEKVIGEEYGKRGLACIKMGSLRGKNILIVTGNQSWSVEVIKNKNSIMEKLNREFGGEEIGDITVS